MRTVHSPQSSVLKEVRSPQSTVLKEVHSPQPTVLRKARGALACGLLACWELACWPPVAPVAPVDHDGLGTELGDACATLRLLRCPEGEPLVTGQTCYEHLSSVSERVQIPATCVRDAGSLEAVRICGDKSMLRFRCVVER